MISVAGDYAWKELDEQGRQIQAKVLEDYRHLCSILRVLLREQPVDTLRTLATTDKTITNIIEQRHTPLRRRDEALQTVTEALETQVLLLTRLYDPSAGEIVFVPDTNAMLYNLALENWRFDDVPRFTIVLTPTVLAELDSLKINHRNEAVRNKAEKLIRQVKEYRRRGRLVDGVVLVKGASTIQTVATEPDMEKTLPWLDPHHNDDRFLASFVEVMRARPRSSVVLVTRDINLQNKAEFARLPFIEPPEPS